MLGENLFALRKSHNLTQIQLAEAVGISRQAYNNYENNRREPDYELVNNFAEYFNVSTDYLLGRTDEKTHPPKKDGYAVIQYDSETLNELMAVISALPKSEQEKLLDFAKYQAARLDKPKDK